LSARGGRIGHGERLLALRRVPLVAGFSPADLALLVERLVERELEPGEALLAAGEPVGALHFLVDGRVRVERRGGALGEALPGAVVGGLAFLARCPEGVAASALEPSLCLSLDGDDAAELFEDRFPMLHDLLRATCERLIGVQRHLQQCGPPGSAAVALPAARRELDLVERILILRHSPAFARASLNALAELSRSMQELRLPAGAELWAEGAPSGALLLVVDGQVRCASADGYCFDAGPGAPLGALESVAERPRWFGARALTPVVALQGHAEALIDVFEDNHEMARDYLAFVARWLLRATEIVGPRAWPADLLLSPLSGSAAAAVDANLDERTTRE
jgi:CRP-like cAMP-binding protein